MSHINMYYQGNVNTEILIKKPARHEKELRIAFIVEIRDVIKFLRQIDETIIASRKGRQRLLSVCV